MAMPSTSTTTTTVPAKAASPSKSTNTNSHGKSKSSNGATSLKSKKPSSATTSFGSTTSKTLPTAFIHLDNDEPHRQRRKEILAKHPEIKQLFGPDIRILPVILTVISVQLSLAVYSVRLPWLYWFLLAYSIGGTLTHWLSLGNHELSHNLCFKKTVYNEMLGMLVNCAQGLPSAITFKRYHLEHHYFQGYNQIDMDIPSLWEGRFFNSTLKKVLWVILQPAFYALRPVFLNPKVPQLKEAINTSTTILFNATFAYLFGFKALFFNITSLLLGMGLHPVAGHFIAEHYTLSRGNGGDENQPQQETYSYYGPLNLVAFNVGYHNEHHDFPRVSGFRLPQVKAMAPEFYDNLDSYDSWTSVIYQYITRPDIGPFSRVIRDDQRKP